MQDPKASLRCGGGKGGHSDRPVGLPSSIHRLPYFADLLRSDLHHGLVMTLMNFAANARHAARSVCGVACPVACVDRVELITACSKRRERPVEW